MFIAALFKFVTVSVSSSVVSGRYYILGVFYNVQCAKAVQVQIRKNTALRKGSEHKVLLLVKKLFAMYTC